LTESMASCNVPNGHKHPQKLRPAAVSHRPMLPMTYRGSVRMAQKCCKVPIGHAKDASGQA